MDSFGDSLGYLSESVDFFADIPWGNIPPHRASTLSHVSALPRGGLLGGSSKLAALAAARKKKEAEKAAAAEAPSNDRSIDLLDRLGKEKSNGPAQPTQHRAMTLPSRQKKQAVPEPEKTPEPVVEKMPAVVPREDLRAKPSIFAETLFGSAVSQVQGGVSLDTEDTTMEDTKEMPASFTLPYMSDPNYVKEDPFVKPSPDDVVLRAQGRSNGS